MRLLIALLFFAAFPLHAQDAYPSRPVRLILPFPAGGPLDLLGRLTAQKLTEQWGKPVVVENVSGGSGSIGANQVARAAPDGYTVLLTVDIPLTMYPAIAKSLPYDPRRDFRPVASVARTANGLFVNPAKVSASNTQELVALAKRQPGKLTFSSAGIGAPAHFAGELFKSIAGIDMIHVPYKGAAPAMAAAVAGEVDMMFGPITQGLPQVKAGKLRAFGVTGAQGSPLLPGVKPFVEQGFAGLVVDNFYPVMLPARTPDSVVNALSAGLKRVFDDADVRARLEAAATVIVWEGPDEVLRNIENDTRRWADLARKAKIEPPQ
ncbi:MAG: Bug family tripartite tricarboxylate transporter substrate binding protein [Betaproteobacteria bacterium]